MQHKILRGNSLHIMIRSHRNYGATINAISNVGGDQVRLWRYILTLHTFNTLQNRLKALIWRRRMVRLLMSTRISNYFTVWRHRNSIPNFLLYIPRPAVRREPQTNIYSFHLLLCLPYLFQI